MTASDAETIPAGYFKILPAIPSAFPIIAVYIFPPKQSIPAIAPNESCKLRLHAAYGFLISTIASTADSDVTGSFSRLKTGASKSSDCIKPALTADGEESECGWLKDRFGVSWQVVPTRMLELQADPDPDRRQRAVQAMFGMRKLVIADLERAADAVPA